ncbi:TniQ family protein [Vibrio sp. THAF190c]|uniref:TniQ family protein n=1 Tax=Vibrio sp. THAF190c TaxID=2587865 RepID=UPI0012A8306D|nr:TniQ family protein [Vibrio sp. THAF190c]QFT11220.1 TniQ [Vibrio sp. THAF190c]
MLLPIRPRLQEGELLSSWVTRLALGNRVYTHTLFSELLDFKGDAYYRDIDRLSSLELLELLTKATGFSTASLRKAQLHTYEGELFEAINPTGNTKWILPLGIYHRTKLRFGVVYCPKCLAEDQVKFFRKIWRLSFITICPKHKCLLRDSCSNCGANIDFQRLSIGYNHYELPPANIALCHNCFKPLWLNKTEQLPPNLKLISNEYISFVERFAHRTGVLPELHQPLELQLFNGVWALSGRMLSKRANEVRERIFEELGVDIRSSANSQTDSVGFNFLGIEQRRKVLTSLFYYFPEWPYRWLNLTKNTKFSLSAFSDVNDELPYWLSSTAYFNMNAKQYVVTDKEIVSAINYLSKRSPKVTKRAIASLLNINVSTLNHRLKKMTL